MSKPSATGPVIYVVTVEKDHMRENTQYYRDKFVFEEVSGRACWILHYSELSHEWMERIRPLALIHSGGRATPDFPREPAFESAAYRSFATTTRVPQLAVCRAFQIFSVFFGGRVGLMRPPSDATGLTTDSDGYVFERGVGEVTPGDNESMLFEGVASPARFYQNHRNAVLEMPECLETNASNEVCPVQGWRHRNMPVYGTQFHPERENTPDGRRLLKNFFAWAATQP